MTSALQPQQKTAVQVRKPLTIRERLGSDEFKRAVAEVLPKCLTPDRFLRVAILATTKTPKLLQCDQGSFFNALLTLSQYGLEPDGRRAHLIPFENRKRNVTECQLIIDYKGLAELAMRSGVVSNIHADIVCENDEFDYDCGELKRHKIDFRKPRGAVYAVYCVCRFKDGTQKTDVMTIDEVDVIRKRSRAGSNGPWATDYNEMAKKTVFRRLSKWLPLSPEFRDAIDHDDEPVIDVAANAAPSNLVAVAGFELPESTEGEPAECAAPPANDGDGDDGDLGPQMETAQPESTAPVEPSKPVEHETPQVALSEAVKAAGFDFNTFQKWADQSNSVPDATSLAGFRDIKTADAERLLRAFRGAKSRPMLIEQLTKVKGELL